jgi:hypothetical protein
VLVLVSPSLMVLNLLSLALRAPVEPAQPARRA